MNQPYTILLLILMIIPVVFAECPPNCPDSSSDDIDYSSPDDVNSMEPQDLASAIEQGKISDMSIVDDNKLSEALSNNPSISAKLEDGDLARAVNQDLSLLDNPSVMSDFDSRAQSDTHILNDNPNIKKKWFADKGITDEGAELETYDGSTVKTKGSQATTFNINNHPEARVLPTIESNDSQQSGWKLIPNPSREKLRICNIDDGQTLDKIRMIFISDISGSEIEEAISISNLNVSEVEMDVSQLAKGVYFIRIATESGNIYNLKFIRE